MGPELAPAQDQRSPAPRAPTDAQESGAPLAPMALGRLSRPPMLVGNADGRAERDADRGADQALARARRSGVEPSEGPEKLRYDPLRGHLRRSSSAGPVAPTGLTGWALPEESTAAIERLRSPGRPVEEPGRQLTSPGGASAVIRRGICGSREKRQEKEEQEENAALAIQTAWRGHHVRENVARVRSVGDGIFHTRVRGGGVPPDSPLGNLRGTMSPGAQYDRLTVLNGAANGRVVEHQATTDSPAETADVLAKELDADTAFINGGFFSPAAPLNNEKGEKVISGVPVGPTMGRPLPGNELGKHTPIPSAYANTYGHLRINGSVGLSSGPMLAMGGNKTDIPTDDAYKYTVVDENGRTKYNPNSMLAGALTHTGDKNPRSAISTTDTGHAVLHTLTADPRKHGAQNQELGATMKEWQDITDAGARVPHPKRFDNRSPVTTDAEAPVAPDVEALVKPRDVRHSTLNLDGGGSVFMGIRRPDEVESIAGKQRRIANIVGARSHGDHGDHGEHYGELSITKSLTPQPDEDSKTEITGPERTGLNSSD